MKVGSVRNNELAARQAEEIGRRLFCGMHRLSTYERRSGRVFSFSEIPLERLQFEDLDAPIVHAPLYEKICWFYFILRGRLLGGLRDGLAIF